MKDIRRNLKFRYEQVLGDNGEKKLPFNRKIPPTEPAMTSWFKPNKKAKLESPSIKPDEISANLY